MYRIYLNKSDATFIVGILLCDVSLLAKAQKLPNLLRRLAPRYPAVWWIPFLLGLYVSPFGHGFATSRQAFSGYPGYTILFATVPPKTTPMYWFRFWASALIVVPIHQIPVLKRMLEGRTAQFLGRVSFALYLLHGPLVWSIGVRLYVACGLDDRYPELEKWHNLARLPGGPLGLEIKFLVPLALSLVILLASSELFTRYVDEPSIKFVQWCFSAGQPAEVKNTESALPLLEMNEVVVPP
jgi:peptidoglycan/LPS O-acetylase OafA/YrhL